MVTSLSVVAYSVLKDAAGVAGNIFAFGLFVSPIPTFRRIIRNGSTEEFSGLPYIYTLLNCMICAWYGSPFVSIDNILITTVNSTGAIFQLVYISLFIAYAERVRKMKMLGLLSAVVVSYAILVTLSLRVFDFNSRQIFVGFLSCASLISMFASPLFIIRLVIRTKSVEYMPFYLSLSSFLMSMSFFTYGMLNWDAFIYVPNGIGALLAIIQLGLRTDNMFVQKCNAAVLPHWKNPIRSVFLLLQLFLPVTLAGAFFLGIRHFASSNSLSQVLGKFESGHVGHTWIIGSYQFSFSLTWAQFWVWVIGNDYVRFGATYGK
uniref:Bidirectional sugar transporter SWEET n=1 Tax=Chenopodium quinoa TaxID=63459 RepID=A0A803LW13_CHEQI